MDRYFDVIYYSLALVILLAVGYSTFAGLKLRSQATTSIFKRRALGISLAAIGTAIALIGGLLSDSFLKSSLYFQQARFAAYYVGFALITFGLQATARASQATLTPSKVLSHTKFTSFLVWFLFLATLALSVFYLLNPATFILNQYGLQVQRTVYWLPMLTTTLVGAVLLFLIAFELKEGAQRIPLLWIGAYAALVFVGLLQESLILPDFGNPLTSLLVAFVPFVFGSLCLSFGVSNLLKKDVT